MQECEKPGLEFVETGENPAEMFDFSDQAFDKMALFIEREITVSVLYSVCFPAE